MGAVTILWRHALSPRDRVALIKGFDLALDQQLTSYRQHLWQHINLKSKKYTGY